MFVRSFTPVAVPCRDPQTAWPTSWPSPPRQPYEPVISRKRAACGDRRRMARVPGRGLEQSLHSHLCEVKQTCLSSRQPAAGGPAREWTQGFTFRTDRPASRSGPSPCLKREFAEPGTDGARVTRPSPREGVGSGFCEQPCEAAPDRVQAVRGAVCCDRRACPHCGGYRFRGSPQATPVNAGAIWRSPSRPLDSP